MLEYSLRLRESVLRDDPPFVGEISGLAVDWQRSIRAVGGFWTGGFRVEGDLDMLQDIFYTWLGYDLEEQVGGNTTWEGMLYELDLVHDGVRRRRSLDLMSNRIRTTYIDPNSDVQESSWVTNDVSIGQYGQKDLALVMDSLPQPAAEAYRDRALVEYAWPWARPVSAGRVGDTMLEASACGYIFTANWRYCTEVSEYDTQQVSYQDGCEFDGNGLIDTGQDFTDWETTSGDATYSIWVTSNDGDLFWGYCGAAYMDESEGDAIYVYQDQALTTPGWNGPFQPGDEPNAPQPENYYIRGPAHDWLNDIVETDCEFLSVGSIDDNYMQVNRMLSSQGRCWDTISDLVELGDTDGDPWQFWVDVGRKCYYEQIDTTPRYFLRGGQLYDSIGGRVALSPWTIRPAVVRDAAYTVTGRAEYQGWLEDARDIFVEEVHISADGTPSLRTALYDEADMMTRLAKYLYGVSGIGREDPYGTRRPRTRPARGRPGIGAGTDEEETVDWKEFLKPYEWWW